MREKEPSVTAYEMEACTAILEDSEEDPQNRYDLWRHTQRTPSQPTTEIICTSMFIAVLFTITKKRNQPTHCQHMGQHICQHKITVVHMNSGISFYFLLP